MFPAVFAIFIHFSGDRACIKDYVFIDGACGTGGMLTVGEEHIKLLASRRQKNVSIKLFGQANADETYAIARADMLVKGEGAQANNIRFGSTISDDKFAHEEFDFMLSNAREVFGLTARNRINKGFPGQTPLFLCPETRAVRNRMAA